MSFILEQLKKSGKQRELKMALQRQTDRPIEKAAEPLLAQSMDRTDDSTKKWHVAAIAVLLGVAAAYGGYSLLRGGAVMRQPASAPAEIKQTSALPSMSSSGPSVQIPSSPVHGERDMSPATTAEIQTKTGIGNSEIPAAAPKDSRAVREKTVISVPAEERTEVVPAAKKDVSTGLESSGPVLEYKQLPQAVRKSLPEIRITSHLYRKDSQLVSINGRIMSEGYNMDDGLYLEEITPEGAILSYGKHRFLVRMER